MHIKDIIDHMKEAETLFANGQNKKSYVLEKLRLGLKLDQPAVDMVSHLIDVIILVDKKDVRIKPKCRACW